MINLIRRIWLLLIFVLPAVAVEFKHAAPPPSDPCLTNRFGRSWSKPISTGYLVVRGRYIDAPYVVEQRGYKIFVNNVRTARLDPRLVLPLPEPPPVTEDPGMPQDLTRDSTLGHALMHPVTIAKWRYWYHIGLYGQKRIKAEWQFFSSLPCIAKVEDTKQPGIGNTRKLRLWDHQGKSMDLPVPLAPRPPRRKFTDKELYGMIMGKRGYVEKELRLRHLVFAKNAGIVYVGGYPSPTDEWQRIFAAFTRDVSPKKRLAELKALGFILPHKNLESAEHFFPVSNFHASNQLWRRLKGDDSWKDDANRMLYALTNGRQRIPPRFQREPAKLPSPAQTKESISNESARPLTTALGESVLKQQSTAPAPLKKILPGPDIKPPRRHLALVLISLGILIAITCTVLYLRRQR